MRRARTMEIVTVSPKFQIAIPRSIRQSFGIKPGQKLHFIEYNGTIRLIPVMEPEEARGFMKCIDTTIEDEPEHV
jgi:AbrB family looped-hinge helix DNA binding protein